MKIVTQETEYPYKSSFLVKVQKMLDGFICYLPKRKRKFEKNGKILVVKPDNLGDILLNSVAFAGLNKSLEVHYMVSSKSYEFASHILNSKKIFIFDHFMHNRNYKSKFVKLIIFFSHIIKFIFLLRWYGYKTIILARIAPGNLIVISRIFSNAFIIGSPMGGFPYWLDFQSDCSNKYHELNNQKALLECFNISLKRIVKKNRSNKKNLSAGNILVPNSGDVTNEFSKEFWWKRISELGIKEVTILGDRENEKLAFYLRKKNFLVKNLSKKTSLTEFLNIIENAKMVLCLDSFAAHYAAHLGIQTYAFYKNYANTVRWAAKGDNVRIIVIQNIRS